MAQFTFQGAQVPIYLDGVPLTQTPKVTHIRIPKKDGTKQIATAPDQETGFLIDENLGIEVTDATALKYCRCDPRLEEVV